MSAGPQRQMSSRGPPSAYAPSSYGGGSVRRRPTRRNTARAPSSRGVSTYYEEDEEGYVSGDYDDGPVYFELTKIRVKVGSLRRLLLFSLLTSFLSSIIKMRPEA